MSAQNGARRAVGQQVPSCLPDHRLLVTEFEVHFHRPCSRFVGHRARPMAKYPHYAPRVERIQGAEPVVWWTRQYISEGADMQDAVIVEAVRTPVGKRNGGLSGVHPADLSAHVLNSLVE